MQMFVYGNFVLSYGDILEKCQIYKNTILPQYSSISLTNYTHL